MQQIDHLSAQASVSRGEHPRPSASAPRPDQARLRDAYLSLLALGICDLAGAATQTVARNPGGDMFWRELLDDEVTLRLEGRDWPMRGLSMSGLQRLHALRSCAERIVAEEVPGDAIDVGAWRGGTALLLRATLDSLEGTGRSVWAADSFAGYPYPAGGRTDDNPAETDLAELDLMAVRRSEVEEMLDRFGLGEGVRILEGFFEQTLPGLREERWSLICVDTRVGDSTALALRSLYPRLARGGWVSVDGWDDESVRGAVAAFRSGAGSTEPLEEVTSATVVWQKETDVTEVAPNAGDGLGERPPQRGTRLPNLRVPSSRELELQAEVAALRARLTDAAFEIARLGGKS